MCSDMTVEKRPLVGLWVDGELWKILNTTFYRILDWKGRQVVWPDTRGVNGLRDARRRPRLWPSPCWKRLLGLSRLKIYWDTILNGALKHGIRTCNGMLVWRALWNFSKLTVTPLADTGRSPAGAKTVIILMFMTSSSQQPPARPSQRTGKLRKWQRKKNLNSWIILDHSMPPCYTIFSMTYWRCRVGRPGDSWPRRSPDCRECRTWVAT